MVFLEILVSVNMEGFHRASHIFPASMRDYKYIVSWEENRCLLAICHGSVAIHSLSMDQLSNG